MTGVWEQLWGQDRVREVLRSSASEPSDSYLFVGPPGVGKFQSARVFAAAVLCEDDGCGECSHCTRVLRGVHPDVEVFEPEGFTYPVDAIREMVVSASQSPLVADRRVFVLREADRVAERSQNALLKALEEPNPSVTWVLIAVSLDAFLPTLLSRCRIVEFPGVAEDAVEMLIRERFDLPDEEAGWIARAARGDLEMAIALVADTRARLIRDIAYEVTCEEQPSVARVLAASQRVEEIAEESRREAEARQEEELKALEDVAGGGREGKGVLKRVATRYRREQRRAEMGVTVDFLGWLGVAFRDLAFVSAGGDPGLSTAPDHADGLLRGAPVRSTKQWFELVDRAVRGRVSVLENANPPLVVESVMLRLATSPSARVG